MSALTIEKIRKHYGQVETLKGIELSLESGEFLVLLGSSGCGKSTLLNIIAGLAEPTSGDIRIGERSIIGVHPKDRDIAMVFQSYALYPNLSVARNIGFGLEMRGVPIDERQKAVREAANLLQIENLLDRKPGQLSGGQRQRVAIGRALVRRPKIFLFDEPLSNLDAKLRMEMRTELKRLHQMIKTTVVYVTHDQIEAMTLATRIAVMRNGLIEQFDTPEAVYNRPASLYVSTFVGAPPMNLLRGRRMGDGIAIEGSGATVPLAGDVAGNIPLGSDVVIGIRPEVLRNGGEGVALPVRVDVTELTGPELIVTGSIGNQRLLAATSPTARISPGDTAVFIVDPGDIHLFDPVSETRIN